MKETTRSCEFVDSKWSYSNAPANVFGNLQAGRPQWEWEVGKWEWKSVRAPFAPTPPSPHSVGVIGLLIGRECIEIEMEMEMKFALKRISKYYLNENE